MFIVVLLVAIAAPVFADQKATPNDNAKWGQVHKNIEDWGFEKVSDATHSQQAMAAADPYNMNLGQFINEICKPWL
jgi:hypothetical protein